MLKTKAEKCAFVFTRTKNIAKKGQRHANSLSIDRAFKKGLEAAEIVDFRFHDLRHSTSTRLADAGVPMNVIAEIMGHNDLRTTKRYTHATDPARREAMKKLSQYSEKPEDQSK